MAALNSKSANIRFAEGKRRLLLGAGAVALSLPMLPTLARAENYTVNNETELADAIAAANASTDPSARIVLGSSFSVSSALPPATKPIEIDTGTFVLTGATSPLTFSGNFDGGLLTLSGSIAGSSSGTVTSGLVLSRTTGSSTISPTVVNNAAITGGSQSTTGVAGVQGVSVGALNFVNNGTITGGSAISYTGSGLNSGAGVSMPSSTTLQNNAGGLIQGGSSQGAGAGAGVYAGNGGTIINAGIIRGGSDVNGVATGAAAIRGQGSATTAITNTGLIEGGVGAAAIAPEGSTVWNALIVNSGTIRAGAGSVDAIQFGGNGTNALTLELHAGSVIEGNVTASGGNGSNFRLGGDIDDSFDISSIGPTAQYRGFGNFQKTGASTWTLFGNSNQVTGWTIDQGKLLIGDGDMTFTSIFNYGVIEFSGSGNVTTGGVSGTGSVIQSGSGTTTLGSGNNNYTGGTTITGGTLVGVTDTSLGDSASALTIDGGTLRLTGGFSSTATRTVTLGARGGTFDITTANIGYTISNGLTTGGALVKSGAGTLTLLGDNGYTGGTTIDAGSLVVGNGGATGKIVGDVLDNGSLTFNSSADWSFDGAISGTGSFTKGGTGAVTMTGASTYTGATSLSGGGKILLTGGAIDGTSAVTMTGGSSLIVDGDGAKLNSVGALTMSNGVGNVLSALNGADISVGSVTQANTGATSLATINIIGAGSTFTDTGTLAAASGTISGTANINVLDGGYMSSASTVTLGNAQLATNSRANVIVSGAGSQWAIGGALTARRGSITVAAGGTLSAASAVFGYAAGTSANNPLVDILVTGAGSQLSTTGALSFINTATNAQAPTLTIADGGLVTVGGGTFDMGANLGVLNIGGAEGAAATGAGTLDADFVTTGSGSRINFNHTDPLYSFDALISGAGVVNQVSGTTALTANNSYTGATTISGGTLRINGDQSAATGLTSVLAGGTLGGSGIVGGDVTVADGGTIAPGNSPGTLTINGDLTLNNGSLLAFEFGDEGVAGGSMNDMLDVKGDLTLDGTINVTTSAGGSFDTGIYRVADYGGTLNDNGLDVGTVPTGATAYIQTSVAGQVNLINTGGQTLSFWDGATGGKFDHQITGGSGVWQAGTGNDNWALADGSVNAAYSDGTFAVFTGTAGTVTVDNSLGAVTASGMQFASDGYRIAGGALTLTDAQSVIRVGDGTSAGAGYTATIASVLTGTGGLVKTDLGMLVLTGANTYTGGTYLDGGVLSAGADSNFGSGGALNFDGGTLRWTGLSYAPTRTINWGANGGGFEIMGSTAILTISRDLNGGALTKSGAGRLTLTGDDVFSGVTISAGALQIGNGATGTLTGNIVNNATLAFAGSNSWTYTGSITGTGSITSISSGTVTFTGDSNYTGGTTLASGGGTFRYLGGTVTAGGATSLTSSNLTVDAGATYSTASVSARFPRDRPRVRHRPSASSMAAC
ncbi:autotransporter-associated beta strand repeat-containing protein [Novosphingobium sp. BL-8A]|uniref:beta strand repeat-containing protein n=1 Tax=Novosphingobium sp. BL-8A TaxID=3127639 RepID=UPI003757B0A4